MNKYRAEVDAPEFGKGFTIRLDMDGHGKLETEFGEFVFVQKVLYGLAALSSRYVGAFLAVALRRDGELVKDVAIPDDVPLEAIARKCLDAFTLFRYGKQHEEWVADNEKTVAEKTNANPTKGTAAKPNTGAITLSVPASRSATSGA